MIGDRQSTLDGKCERWNGQLSLKEFSDKLCEMASESDNGSSGDSY